MDALEFPLQYIYIYICDHGLSPVGEAFSAFVFPPGFLKEAHTFINVAAVVTLWMKRSFSQILAELLFWISSSYFQVFILLMCRCAFALHEAGRADGHPDRKRSPCRHTPVGSSFLRISNLRHEVCVSNSSHGGRVADPPSPAESHPLSSLRKQQKKKHGLHLCPQLSSALPALLSLRHLSPVAGIFAVASS